jgi:hypothetical protein
MKGFIINSREDIAAFFNYLVHDLGLSFHPDTPFSEYVQPDNSLCFTLGQVEHLEGILEQCYAWCHAEDIDIYDIALDTFHQTSRTRGN